MIDRVKSTLAAVLIGLAAGTAAPLVQAGDPTVPGTQVRSIPPAEQRQAASRLRAADAPAPQGPAEACLDQFRTVMCPIIGQMPFFRDVAGQISMWGGFSCPIDTAALPLPAS
jgi:hypothetical protein